MRNSKNKAQKRSLKMAELQHIGGGAIRYSKMIGDGLFRDADCADGRCSLACRGNGCK